MNSRPLRILEKGIGLPGTHKWVITDHQLRSKVKPVGKGKWYGQLGQVAYGCFEWLIWIKALFIFHSVDFNLL